MGLTHEQKAFGIATMCGVPGIKTFLDGVYSHTSLSTYLNSTYVEAHDALDKKVVGRVTLFNPTKHHIVGLMNETQPVYAILTGQ